MDFHLPQNAPLGGVKLSPAARAWDLGERAGVGFLKFFVSVSFSPSPSVQGCIKTPNGSFCQLIQNAKERKGTPKGSQRRVFLCALCENLCALCVNHLLIGTQNTF